MTALAAIGRILGALAVVAGLAAGAVFVLCLAVVYGAPILDAITGGLTP